jgi:hypothetical protein
VAGETPHGEDRETRVWHGIPHDTSRPTLARNRARYFNSDDPRFFTPKVYGAGWTVNFYWVLHPGRYLSSRRNGVPR